MALSLPSSNLALSSLTPASAPTNTAPAASNAPAKPAVTLDSLELSSFAAANSPVPATTAAPAAVTGSTYTVKPGDTLSGIAKQQLGDAQRWPEIYNLNQDQIQDPDLIYPGQTFKLPDASATPAPAATTPTTGAPTSNGPTTADLPAPAATTVPSSTAGTVTGTIRMPGPLPMPAPGPTNCFPVPRPWPPRQPVDPIARRDQMLRQKLEMLKMEQQVVQMELELDRMLRQMDDQAPAPTPPRGPIYLRPLAADSQAG